MDSSDSEQQSYDGSSDDYVPDRSGSGSDSGESALSEELGVPVADLGDSDNEEDEDEDDPDEWRAYQGRAPHFNFNGGGPLVNPVVPRDGQTVDPLDVYSLFVTPEVLQHMVDHTNRYAEKYIGQRRPLTRTTRLRRWKPCTVPDMLEFLSILIYMGLQRNTSIKEYWSHDFTTAEFAMFAMSRDFFELMLRFWHFADPDGGPEDDRLAKVRPLITEVVANIKRAVVLGEKATVDETMIPWRGRLGFRQYIPGKRHKYGVKMYKLCQPDGFTYDADIYCGRAEMLGNLGSSDSVVAGLTRDIVGSGRSIYADNYFTSVPLAKYLLDRQLYITGTLRTNRRGLPRDVVDAKLARGDVVSRETTSGVTVAKWRDRRDVLMISTKSAPTMADSGRQNRQGVAIQKPQMVLEYNKAKMGIDLSDQMSSYHAVLRRTLFWYKRVGIEVLLGIGIVNAYIIYKREILVDDAQRKRCTMTSFKKDLMRLLRQRAKDLRAEAGVPPAQRERLHVIPGVAQGHRLETSSGRGGGAADKRRRCSGCYKRQVDEGVDTNTAKSRAKKVKTFCPGCENKALCSECFFADPVHQSN